MIILKNKEGLYFMKYYVLGDIGGQLKVFEESLRRMNVSTDYVIPKDVTIIQVGDIYRMSDHLILNNIGCLKVADKLIKNNPNNYIQLFGNHESPFINGRIPPIWRHAKALQDQDAYHIVNNWWRNNLAKMAHTLETADGDILITHAGVSYDFLKTLNLENNNATTIANHLNQSISNSYYYKDSKVGIISFENSLNLEADNLWTASSDEFYPTWINKNMGFHQIHGHDTPLLSWENPQMRTPNKLESFDINVDYKKRLIETHVGYGWTIKTCDWVLKTNTYDSIQDYGIIEIDI